MSGAKQWNPKMKSFFEAETGGPPQDKQGGGQDKTKGGRTC